MESQSSTDSVGQSIPTCLSSVSLPLRSIEPIRRKEISLGCASAKSSIYLRDEHVQDGLFSIIVDALSSLFRMGCLEEYAKFIVKQFETLLTEHFNNPTSSRIRILVSDVKTFFTLLPFAEAFNIYNQKYRITRRMFIPPTFHEIRHVMNIAQVMAVKSKLRLVTLDGDETLYPDRRNFEDVDTAHYLTTLLEAGTTVAVVTAAGYGYQTEKYERRFCGLLGYWKRKKIPSNVTSRFFLFGGESNYLIRCTADCHLKPVPDEEWRVHLSQQMKVFFSSAADHDHDDNNNQNQHQHNDDNQNHHQHQHESHHVDSGSEGSNSNSNSSNNNKRFTEVQRLLAVAADELELCCEDLALRSIVIRKERAVGLVPGGAEGRRKKPIGSGTASLKPEILEEVFYRVQQAIRSADPPLNVPFCAFNGGNDVWVDVGNKAEGVRVLQSYLHIQPHECLHIGDQFSASGNDIAARDVSPTLWICNPEETKAVLRSLLRQMEKHSLEPDDCTMDGVDSEDENRF